MYQHILIPTDGSELSEHAVHAGVDLAQAVHAKVTFLTATPPFKVFAANPLVLTDTPETYEKDAEALARMRFRDAVTYALGKGVTAATEHVHDEHPFNAIIESASKNRCDLIVMASHGRGGVKGLLLGSETHKVLTHSKIPVQVCR